MTQSERSATMAVAALVPIISASLWLVGFQRTLTWIKRTAEGGRARADRSAALDEGVKALKRVKRYTPRSGRCLARALALWWLLRRRGVTVVLHLGVRMIDRTLEAHAWVAHEGRVLADSDSVWTDFPGQFPTDGELAFRRD